MNTAKQRILNNYEKEKGTFYFEFVENGTFRQNKFCEFLNDIYTLTKENEGKELDHEVIVALHSMQTTILESCMYHAQEMDNYEIEQYPGNEQMTFYLDELNHLVTSYLTGKKAEKKFIEVEENEWDELFI